MGIRAEDFWDMTPREFFNALRHYNRAQDFEYHQGWERTRWLATITINIQLDPKDRITPEQLIRFEWDQPKEIQKPDREQFERLKKLWARPPKNVREIK